MGNNGVRVRDIVCPKCDAGEGVGCAKQGELVRYSKGLPTHAADGLPIEYEPFHAERWGAAIEFVRGAKNCLGAETYGH